MSRTFLLFFRAFLLSISLQIVAVAQAAPAKSSVVTTRGIESYKHGETGQAIKTLREAIKNDKTDGEAWYYLGLALNRESKTKDARKAFAETVKLRPDFAPAHGAYAYTLLLTNKLDDAEREAARSLELDPKRTEANYVIGVIRLRQGKYEQTLQAVSATLGEDTNFSAAYLLKSQALLGFYMNEYGAQLGASSKSSDAAAKKEARAAQDRRMKEAAESLEKFLKLSPTLSNSDIWRDQLETLRVYARPEVESESERATFGTSEVMTKAIIQSRPEPGFTESARQANINGLVVMRAVLAADGQVKYILVLQSLSHGLTEEAVKAARKIKFQPATIGGRAVSQFITLEYHFNVY